VKARNSLTALVRSGTPFTYVDAPVIEEFPLTMECEVTAVEGDEHGARIVGRVVNTRVSESVLDDEGRVDFGRMRPIVYDSTRRIYRVVGEEVGGAWDAGKALM
jgi:flavin reductase (DIM6/NTAB) family NADH-FMN oxidoreductase RutF